MDTNADELTPTGEPADDEAEAAPPPPPTDPVPATAGDAEADE